MKFNIYGKILLKLDDRVLLHLQIAIFLNYLPLD